METRPDSSEKNKKKLGQSSLVFSICLGAFTTALFTFNLIANAQTNIQQPGAYNSDAQNNPANATTTTPTSSQQTPQPKPIPQVLPKPNTTSLTPKPSIKNPDGTEIIYSIEYVPTPSSEYLNNL